MKKIALITDAWLPQINGVVNTCLSIIPHIEKEYIVKVLHPGMFRNFSYPWYKEIKIAYNTKKITNSFFNSFNPDIVHIVTEGPVGKAGIKFCNQNKWKYTTSFHTRFPEYIEKRVYVPRKFTYGYLRNFHKNAKKVLVPTQSMINELSEYKFQNLYVWSRGVNTNLFNPSKRTRKDNETNITYIGRVSIEKNIKAFLELKTIMKKTVVGDGPELQKLKKKYPGVKFVGLKKGDELAQFYANADVFVFPSKTDTFGNVILEALSSGTPVAAFPVVGPLDIMKDTKVDALDENLEKSLEKALKIKRSDCRDFAMQFTWKNCSQDFISHMVMAKGQ